MNTNHISKDPDFKHITDNTVVPYKEARYDVQQDSPTRAIEQVVYAPNEYGFPCPSAAAALARDPNPEVAQFVQATLMHSNPRSGAGDDADFALDATRKVGESDAQYADRLKTMM